MICPYCKQDIPISCDYCPECGARQVQKMKQQRPKVVPVVVTIIVLLLIIGTLIQEIREKSAENESKSTVQAAVQTVTPEPTQNTFMQTIPVEEPTEKTFESQPVQSREPSPLDDDIIDVDINGCHVTYEGHEVVQNMAGDWCVAVYYEFTNNTDENKAFVYTVRDKAFQNGVELDISAFHVNDDSKTSNLELQPGVSATVCSGFVLRDTSDVELQLYPLITFDKTPTDAMILSLESDG